MRNKYFNLETSGTTGNLYIYGDITSWPWSENDVSSYNLSKKLEELSGIDNLNVYINSYGGEVGEGLAIYNSLKRFKGKVRTYADGFVCSIASVIFMAGEERIMNNASALLIHNAWSYESGDANALRKAADDLDIINNLSIQLYLEKINLTEEKLREYLDKETWINAEDALTYGFATSIEEKKEEKANQSYKEKLIYMILDSKPKVKGEVTSVTISVEDGELKVTTNETTEIEETNISESEEIISNNDTEEESNETDKNLSDSEEDTEEEKEQEKLKNKLFHIFKGGKE